MPRYSEEIIEDLEHMIDGFRTDFQYILDLTDEILVGATEINGGRIDATTVELEWSDIFDKLQTIKRLAGRNKGD